MECEERGWGALSTAGADVGADFSRRRLLARTATVGMSVALGSTLLRSRALADAVAPTDVFVLVFLRGAVDGLNTIVPYGDAHYTRAARPNIGVFDSIPLGDNYFGLHPALGPLIGTNRAWDPALGIGDLALIQACGTFANTRSHFDAQDITDRGVGRKSDSSRDGWLGRHLMARSEQSATLRAVGMAAATPHSLHRPGLNPILMRTPADLGLSSFNSTWAEPALSSLYGGFMHSMSPDAASALAAVTKMRGLGTYSPRATVLATDPAYGIDPLSVGLKTLAQLIKADPTGSPVRFGLEAVAIDHGPYDLHRGMGTSTVGPLRDRLAELGTALAAFRYDLQDVDGTSTSRFWDRVTVCVVSEFGRRLEENGVGGTEHGHGGVAMVLGGGIKAKAPGSSSNVWLRNGWPGLDLPSLDDGDLKVTTDVRDIFREIASVRLGGDSAELNSTVFPSFTAQPLGFAKPK